MARLPLTSVVALAVMAMAWLVPTHYLPWVVFASELTAAAGRMAVVYTALSNGAQIQYTSQDQNTIAALHRWFAAQLADHGRDAAGH